MRLLQQQAIGLLAVAAASVGAVERYQLEALPDAGFGSVAHALYSANDQLAAVGSQQRADASQVAMLWQRSDSDSDNGNWLAQTLSPSNSDAEARAIGRVADDYVIALNLRPTSGGEYATLAFARQPGLYYLPYLATQASRAQALITESANKNSLLIAGSILTDSGHWRAVLWHGDTRDGFEIHELDTLGGADSHANALYQDPTGPLRLVGTAQTETGLWHATVWTQQADGVWLTSDLGVLGTTTTSQVLAAASPTPLSGLLIAAGTVNDETGWSQAATWLDDGAGIEQLDWSLPQNFNQAAAHDFLLLPIPSGQARSFAPLGRPLRLIGSAWNADPSDAIGAIWTGLFSASSDGLLLKSGQGIDVVDTLTTSDWQPQSLNAISTNCVIAGTGIDTTANPATMSAQALVLVPSNTLLPDDLVIRAGASSSEPGLGRVYRHDGVAVKVGADRQGSITLDLPFQPCPRLPAQATLTFEGAASASTPVALDVQIYSHAYGSWISLGQVNLGDDAFSFRLELSAILDDYINPVTGGLWSRLSATSLQPGQRWNLALDYWQLSVE